MLMPRKSTSNMIVLPEIALLAVDPKESLNGIKLTNLSLPNDG